MTETKGKCQVWTKFFFLMTWKLSFMWWNFFYYIYDWNKMWTLHKQMEKVNLKLKFFFTWHETIVSWDMKLFFIYMTETFCVPWWNKRKVLSCKKFFFLMTDETIVSWHENFFYYIWFKEVFILNGLKYFWIRETLILNLVERHEVKTREYTNKLSCFTIICVWVT